MHLGDQGVDRLEAVVAAQAGGEVDGGVDTVEVQVVAVEGVRLDAAVAAAERLAPLRHALAAVLADA